MSSPDLRGVAGWLGFFVFVRLYVDPVLTGLTLLLAWIGATELASEMPGLVPALLVETLLTGTFTVYGVRVGLALRRVEPGAVAETQRFLLCGVGVAVLSPLLTAAVGFSPDAIGPEALKGILQALVAYGIWSSYFRHSKRVQATYGDVEPSLPTLPAPAQPPLGRGCSTNP